MLGFASSTKLAELEAKVREAYGEAEDAYYLLAQLRQSIELAYGLLWMVGSNRATPDGNALYLARKALYDQIDKDAQARGIDAARKHVAENPYKE